MLLSVSLWHLCQFRTQESGAALWMSYANIWKNPELPAFDSAGLKATYTLSISGIRTAFQETGITYNAGSYTVVLAHRNLWLISEQWHKPTKKQCKQHTNYHNPDIFIRRSRYLAFFCCKLANMYQQLDSDTICAISTPSGVGGIAIIRVSGPEA